MLGALINANPTHDQLIKAANWQMDQVDKLISTAEVNDAKDSNSLRKDWYMVKLDWLRVELAAARGILKVGVPSWPWLGKVYQWATKAWSDFKSGWDKFWGIQEASGSTEGWVQDIESWFTDPTDYEPDNAQQAQQGKSMADQFNGIVSAVDGHLQDMKTSSVCPK